MSLTEPNFFERNVKPHWRIIAYCVAGLAVLGLVLFLFDKCGDYRTNRDIEKRKANINAALSNIAVKEGTIANLQIDVAVEKERVKESVKEHLEAVNASDAVKANTNAKLANLDAARNVNTTNSSVQDLEDVLRRLE